jgi:hypothetical protein
MPRNDDALNLRSPLTDIEQFLIPVKSFDIVLFHQAVPAVELNGMIGASIHDLGAIKLAHGGFF